MRISVEDYVARIANASPLDLVIINYEIILDYINASRNSFDEPEDFDFNITKAKQFLNELRVSLDMQYEIAKHLMSLYHYVDQELCYCQFNKNIAHLDEATKILTQLLEGWTTVSEMNMEQDNTPVMGNTEQLYAGLTYGKDGRLQEYVETDNKRGFKA